MDELISHVSEKTYIYGAIIVENQNLLFTISELKTRLENVEKGMNAVSSVRRPMNKDSHVKNSVLANTKKSKKKVAIYVRKNKQTDITSENVISNKENVIDVDVANTSKPKNFVLFVVFLYAKYGAYSMTFRKTRFSKESTLSKSLDTTYVVSKPKIDVRSTSKANNKVVQIVLPWDIISFSAWTFCDGRVLEVVFVIDKLASSPVLSKSKATSTKSMVGAFLNMKRSPLFDCERSNAGSFQSMGNMYILVIVDVILEYNLAMASEHDCFEPELQRFINHNSSAEEMNTPSKEDLDNLFGPLFKEYFEKTFSDTPINSVARLTQIHEDLPSTSLIIVEEHEAPPIVTTSDEQTSPISLTKADEFNQEDPAHSDGNS
ncbi:hypothetical protein Tco_0749954 [Tanacetum coccineum]|uniref:Uncharacterized protein n=1 Tax=Tanacetum coccineum TaxID=301880 RepID=A0ABQ4YZV9_9ASTR